MAHKTNVLTELRELVVHGRHDASRGKGCPACRSHQDLAAQAQWTERGRARGAGDTARRKDSPCAHSLATAKLLACGVDLGIDMQK